MLQSQRQDRILQYLTQHDYLTVEEAVEVFQASPATIRRDFDDLAKKQLVCRVRGGVKPVKLAVDGMVPFALRELQYSAEKEVLALEAVKLLQPGNVIFVDGGTTTFHMGLCLPDVDLRVITNSFHLAAALEERGTETIGREIYLTGGLLYRKSGFLLGPNTETSLGQYHADWAFLSAGGINASGVFNTNELLVEAERVMINNAERVVFLVDHSKIGKNAMCHVCGLDRVDVLITNDWPENRELIETFKERGVEVVLCGDK